MQTTTTQEVFTVNLISKTCICGFWQLSGIPCPHAVASVYHIGLDCDDLVSDTLRKPKWIAAYSNFIRAVGGEIQWPKTNKPGPLPPIDRRMPGRPTIKRKRSRTEGDGNGAGSSTIKRRKCLNCYQYGHNRRSCTNAPFTVTPAPTVPTQRGRPRVHDPSRSSSRSDSPSVNRGGANAARGRGNNSTRRGKFLPNRGGGIRTRSQASFHDSVKEGGSSENAGVKEGGPSDGSAVGVSEGPSVGQSENFGGPSEGGEGVNIVAEEDQLLAEIDEQLQPRSVRQKPANKPFIAPRKKSERIMLRKLGKNVVTKDGSGSAADNPLEMD